MEQKKSVTLNAVLNMLNTFLSMAFSLITYPWVTRALQAENLGKVNYSASIVSYFALIAALGFSTYAIREGSRKRLDSQKLQLFSSQIFTLNAVFVGAAYLLLLLLVILMPSIRPYGILLALQSLVFLTNWLCVDWMNSIFEDYFSITLRSLLVQTVSIILLFSLVKKPEDYYLYAGISVFSNFTAAVINFFYVRKKYCKLGFTNKTCFFQHMKPVLVFFSNTVAVSIYANSDVTMIGYFLGDYEVGLYSVAVKIYGTVRRLIAAAYTAAIPRMAFFTAQNRMEDFRRMLNKMVSAILFVSFPGAVLIGSLSAELTIVLSGQEYEEAGGALAILAFALFFAVMGGCLAYCVATPLKKEKVVLRATFISAMENIVLNIFLVPRFGIYGAAFTTVLAEFSVCISLLVGIKEYWGLFDGKRLLEMGVKCIIAISPALPVYSLFRQVFQIKNHFLMIIGYSAAVVIVYVLIGLVLKNAMITEIKGKCSIIRRL